MTQLWFLSDVAPDELNWSHISAPRRYPPALHSCFYNLWRDNCEALSSPSAGVILSQQTQSVSLLLHLHLHPSSFIFPTHLQLMHLFRGFLLFFKDTHRGHSCRSNHQSPLALLRLPSTSFFTLPFLSNHLFLCVLLVQCQLNNHKSSPCVSLHSSSLKKRIWCIDMTQNSDAK